YFDLDNKLFDKGIWIRYRCESLAEAEAKINCRWNSKLRLGGDFINSESMELEGEENVRNLLLAYSPCTMLEDLELTADLETIRLVWNIRDYHASLTEPRAPSKGRECLSIVLDRVVVTGAGDGGNATGSQFEHEVGEVELTRDIDACFPLELYPERRRQMLDRIGAEVQQYMDEHLELFSHIRPVGKLSAYFDWKDSQ
ncbi:hypothetical protein LTR37_021413, partial [Vermiconidia calcicola]